MTLVSSLRWATVFVSTIVMGACRSSESPIPSTAPRVDAVTVLGDLADAYGSFTSYSDAGVVFDGDREVARFITSFRRNDSMTMVFALSRRSEVLLLRLAGSFAGSNGDWGLQKLTKAHDGDLESALRLDEWALADRVELRDLGEGLARISGTCRTASFHVPRLLLGDSVGGWGIVEMLDPISGIHSHSGGVIVEGRHPLDWPVTIEVDRDGLLRQIVLYLEDVLTIQYSLRSAQ